MEKFIKDIKKVCKEAWYNKNNKTKTNDENNK